MKKRKFKNYLKIGILLFGISLILWNCQEQEIQLEFEQTNLKISTVSKSSAKKIFESYVKEQKSTKSLSYKNQNQALEVIPNWNSFNQEELSFTNALLSNVNVNTNSSNNLKSRLIFINLDNKTLRIIESKEITEFDGDNIKNGNVYYHNLNGEFIFGLKVENSLVSKKLVKQNTQNKASFFSMLSFFDEECDEDLVAGSEFCNNELEEIVITANSNYTPTEISIGWWIYGGNNNNYGYYNWGTDGNENTGGGSNNTTVKKWYYDGDGDGYYGDTKQFDYNPGAGWSLNTSGPDCDDTNPLIHTKNSCDSCAPEIAVGNRCPCFGVTSSTDTSNLLNTDIIEEALNSAGLANFSSAIIGAFTELGLINKADITGGAKNILNAKSFLGDGLGLLSIGVSAVNYLEEPSSQNLLRFVFDSLTSNPATVATLGLGISLVELYKNNNGESVIDRALKAVGNKIDELSDCDFGAGVHGLIF